MQLSLVLITQFMLRHTPSSIYEKQRQRHTLWDQQKLYEHAQYTYSLQMKSIDKHQETEPTSLWVMVTCFPLRRILTQRVSAKTRRRIWAYFIMISDICLAVTRYCFVITIIGYWTGLESRTLSDCLGFVKCIPREAFVARLADLSCCIGCGEIKSQWMSRC